MLSVTEAQAAIYTHVPLLTITQTGLRELTGSVLAESIFMERDQPPFQRVMMDGIAVRSSATTRDFRIVGTQAAGAPPILLTKDDECIEVMTGAELPVGCDCVIPVEQIKRSADRAQLLESTAISPWLNVHRRGSDALQGRSILQPGVRLGATEVAVLASAGYATAQVRQSPRIALVSTGDELVEPGEPIQNWQIRRSNTYALRSALEQHGHRQVIDRHLADDLPLLRHTIDVLLQENDVLILSGGVSMGQFDYVPQVLTELGVQCIFHKVEQRPGKPMWFGIRNDGKVVYALPGNPVSTLICLYRYVLPGLLRSMAAATIPDEQITLQSAVKAHPELSIFMPVRLKHDDQAGILAEPCPTRGSGDFISLLGTQGFVELPPAQGMIDAGTLVPFYRW